MDADGLGEILENAVRVVGQTLPKIKCEISTDYQEFNKVGRSYGTYDGNNRSNDIPGAILVQSDQV